MRNALLIAVLCVGCASAPPPATAPLLDIPPEEALDVIGAPEQQIAQLAVEVEVTRDAVRPLDASILRGPRKANAAVEDLAVTIGAAEETLYTMADPRIAEVEARSTLILDAARSWIFLPIGGDLSVVRLVPLRTRHPEASRGGRFDARPLLAAACRKAPDVPECANVVK